MKDLKIYKSEKLKLHNYFRMVEVLKQDGIQERQHGVFKIENGKVYKEVFCQLDWIEDKGDSFYVGYTPVGKSKWVCGAWGCTHIYKEKVPEWGVVEIKEVEWAEAR